MEQIKLESGSVVGVNSSNRSGTDGIGLSIGMVTAFLAPKEARNLIEALTDFSKIRHIYDEDDRMFCRENYKPIRQAEIHVDDGRGILCNKCRTQLTKWAE